MGKDILPTNKLSDITGSVQLRGNNYLHLIINAGYDISGKRNRISFSTGLKAKGNMRKANNILVDTIQKLEELREITGKTDLKELHSLIGNFNISEIRNLPEKQIENSDMLFSEVVNEYMQYHDVHENTKEKNRYAAKHIISHFQPMGITIQQLSTADIAKYFAIKKNGDAEKGIKKLSPRTLSSHKTVINGSINYAIKILKIIDTDPALGVHAPKKEIRMPSYYTQGQLNSIFEKIQGESIESAVILAATYGLRRGEVLGLKWSAIDWDNNSILVRHTVTKVGKKILRENRTKSTSSNRAMPLSDDMKQMLKTLYIHQRGMKAVMKTSYYDSDYICKWEDGRPFRPDYVTSRWSDFLKKHGFPHIRFHDLRHANVKHRQTNFSSFFTYFHIGESISTFRCVTT